MDENSLSSRLRALRPPESEQAKLRAIEAVPARVHPARSGRPRRSPIRWPRLATASALSLAVLASFSLFTAPGHAVTSWVGDSLGLGQPGGPPALQSLHQHAMRGTDGEGQPAYVLLRGPGPLGGHYEFITYRVRPELEGEFPPGDATCFQLEFPEAGNLFHAGCGLPAASEGLIYAGEGGNSGPAGSAYQFASGRVSEDVTAVDLEVDGQAVPVELRSIPADLIDRLQIERPFKFFIAFLDSDLRSGTLTVTARDAEGQTVARRTSSFLGAPALQP